MSSAPTSEEIAADARWLAHALDPGSGQARLLAMESEAYRAASFLDDRMLQQPIDAQIVPWPLVEEAAAKVGRSDARWIYHIGHVGSTLVSRLLGEIPRVLALREPRLLRDLAMIPAPLRDRYVGPTPALMSRTFAEDELACVKATSLVSEIAPLLVPRGERALLMFATPRNYVASILAGENSIKELRMLAEPRAERLGGRGILLPDARNDAELAALAWACEMISLESATQAMGDRRLMWADFDTMLQRMPSALREVVDHFGFTADDATLGAICSGPLMSSYSKALEYEYSADLRRELIAEQQRYHGPQIDGALAMLHRAAEKSPLLQRALSRAEAGD
ncbi:MAG TPA: hypothetical protein VM145_06320 [Sphingomicrobium sp.]|nr:hypothetical protein [Sphingomicrobium sp.]